MSASSSAQKKQIKVGGNPEEIADAQEQHKHVDSLRSTEGLDYVELKRQADNLMRLRLLLAQKGKVSEYTERGKMMYPEFEKKFPTFFKSIATVPEDNLEEIVQVMHRMLDDLQKVKLGKMTHTEMRTELFENDLAKRYVKRK